MIKLLKDTCRIFENFSFWYIGFASILYIFRYSIKVFMLMYTAALLFLLTRALIKIIRTEMDFYLWTWAKLFSYIQSIILSFSYAIEFGLANLKACMSILITLVIMLSKPEKEHFHCFYLGLKISVLINLIYSGIELFIIKMFDFNFTSILLYKLQLRSFPEEYANYIGNRISGLGWDPFVLGMCCVLGYIFFQNKLFSIYITIILIASGSRAGMLGALVALPVLYSDFLFKKGYIIFFSIIAGLLILINWQEFVSLMTRGFSKDSLGYVRIEYITLVPEIAINKTSLLFSAFGGAPGYSGAKFIYSDIDSMVSTVMAGNKYWMIESDWMSALYGRGIFGILSYFYMYLSISLHQKNKAWKALYLAVFFAGIGYYYDTAIYINLLIYFTMHFQELEVQTKDLKYKKEAQFSF